jgi:hypothetical protein
MEQKKLSADAVSRAHATAREYAEIERGHSLTMFRKTPPDVISFALCWRCGMVTFINDSGKAVRSNDRPCPHTREGENRHALAG